MTDTASVSPESAQPDVRAYVANRIGFLELNRPKALNALSVGMIRTMQQALDVWRDDPDVVAVVVHSPHPRAFCAGGDVRFFHEAWQRGDRDAVDTFFIEEYTLNHAIFTYPKPYIALMHGVVMGGGMGISQAARHTGGLRVVTDSTKMAMPETRIGLFPDVGMSWFLARTPGMIGRYLAVTGATLDAAGALAAQLADVYLPDAALPALIDALKGTRFDDGAQAVACVADAAATHKVVPTPDTSALADARAGIDRHFAQPDIGAIVTSLEGEQDCGAVDGWVEKATHAMRSELSPLSMAVSLEVVDRARGATMAECLRRDLDLTRSTFARGDVIEGVRALIVDKDHQPAWRFKSIADVDRADVLAMFDSPWTPDTHPLRHLKD
ncbi:enoyl-CoA hydratase/isomerase family protein [Burkholderia multivorans]|uniref:enoyl-CoA hydratase/isomerase family protein n=1 Tax=Burkholderia multivorans TaxID=87883 RepID=UPI002019564E|nr:enoyl-CoA hydratase/isomerase family protein [Burkholderia multivorans]MCL4651970.1 enoyl-CoA hydratase/isomerase family protein [Burkholderia multivorans]MCL4654805.1 enoyl-CoA hydratase/isomerase family protein [Burkholderia multivorans]MCO1426475.1 enoyl-CoA hydratase/isomerase family protein [Burkholderia multivorans]UQN53863.1 enoyl-CoA hydratase/isomerase family protein [Burkholderia multivorans]UQN81793.1 enoyl-CoA hydratase/isomerase family protein [Burkholderia multivorans]